MTITVTLTEEQRDMLMDLLDSTDFEESYYRAHGWDMRDGILRETHTALKEATP